MKVPFAALDVATQKIKKEYLKAVEKILDQSHFILSEEVGRFEKDFADIMDSKFAVGVSSGADAIYLALAALGIGNGDEVITQGNAYNASVTAILRTGAVPKFVDINVDTLTLDPSKIVYAITPKTKAILPVHLYGQMADMEAICKIAKEHNLKIIEDCAQAHFASLNGKKAGTWGDAGAFSFYPTKNLGAFGDAGAIVLNNETMYNQLLALRNLGQISKNNHQFLGFNHRLDPIQAVALSLKLPHMQELTEERQKIGRLYNKLILDSGSSIVVPKQVPDSYHVYHLYVVLVLSSKRDEIQKELLSREIETAVHYPVVVYRQPFFKKPFDICPASEQACTQVLSLPLFLGISQEQQEYVINSLAEIISYVK